MRNNDLISRNALLAEYDRVHIGEPGGARKLIAEAPAVDALVFPCKVGDTVWIAGDKFPAEIVEIRITEDGTFFEYAEYDRGYELTELWDEGSFQAADIGKTVFLTREEAEAALAKTGGDG